MLPPPTERQARLIWLALTGLAFAVLVGLLAGVVWGLGRVLQLLSPVLWPLAVAGVLAYLLDPVVDFLERKGASRPRAIVTVFSGALVLAAAIFGSVVPQIINETSQLANRIPTYASQLEARTEYWVSHPPPLVQRLLERQGGWTPAPAPSGTNAASAGSPPDGTYSSTNTPPFFANALDKDHWQTAATWAGTVLRRAVAWLFGRVASWFGVVVGMALIPVYTFYFLLEKRGISSRWTNYLPVADSGFKNELVFILNSINNYLIAFFRGQVLVAICDGTLYTIGFLLVGLPYAVLIGAAAVVLTMVPFLGAIVTCTTALLIAIVQFGDWLHPLLVLGVFGLVQALEGLFISPRIMGGRVGLHPVTILIAVMVGTTLLGGLLGGILAIPVTATLRVLMFRYVWGEKNGETLKTLKR
jgi:predicted PurR-regulated permease PerM